MILQQLRPRRLRSKETFYAPVSKNQVFQDAGLFALEKGTSGGATTLQDITKALDEYRRLFKAGLASNAEKLTLSRAFPDNSVYVEAGILVPESETMVIGGPASVELIDREGHMITNDALNNAFKKYMDNFRTRNAMVLHSDVQVGWALPAYITKGGQIFKSGVGDAGLFFICELRGDTKIAEKVAKQIEEGKLRSYSIAGSATKIQQMQKGLMPYMQVDEMELAEVTVCEKGVNQAAGFEILKAEDKNRKFPDEDEAVLIVDPEEDKPEPVSHVSISINLLEKEDGDIDFTNTFFNYIDKESKMAETSPAAPVEPPSKKKKVGEESSDDSNGHYPNKEIPTNPNIVRFLNHMEKTTTTGEYKPRGVGKQKRKLHPTDVA